MDSSHAGLRRIVVHMIIPTTDGTVDMAHPAIYHLTWYAVIYGVGLEKVPKGVDGKTTPDTGPISGSLEILVEPLRVDRPASLGISGGRLGGKKQFVGVAGK